MSRFLATFAALGLLSGALLLRSDEPFEPIALQWAGLAAPEPTTSAVLVELGVGDPEETDWSGRLRVTGGEIVAQHPYAFRTDDTLVQRGEETSGEEPHSAEVVWSAQSHRPEIWSGLYGSHPVHPVGFVVEVRAEDDTTLHLETPLGEASVALGRLQSGEPVSVLDGRARMRLTCGVTPLADGPTEDDFPAACVGPDGSVYVVYTSYTLGYEELRRPFIGIEQMPPNFDELAEPPGGDQLWLRRYADGQWSEPVAITPSGEDLYRAAACADSAGRVWIAYSAQRAGNFDVYLCRVERNDVSPSLRMTSHPEPDLAPTMTTDQQGNVWLAWQAFRNGAAEIQCAVARAETGQWAEPATVSTGDGNCWDPALAAGPEGAVAIAWDQYRQGDYDVLVRVGSADRTAEEWPEETVVAGSGWFEARPSLVYDTHGNLLIGYEQGPQLWGKDSGFLAQDAGNGLYRGHSVRVVCLNREGELVRPEAPLPEGQAGGPQYSLPRLGLDMDGNVWLIYRELLGREFSNPEAGTCWASFARRLDGAAWSPPILLFRSDNFLDTRPALLPRAGGGLWVLLNGDGRFHAPRILGNDLFAGSLVLPASSDAEETALVAVEPGPPKDLERAAAEQREVAAIRNYRIEAAGRTYQLLRGEFHRHTDFSWDGRNDGTVTDMFRYGLDAAAMDWIGNGDHDNGGGREYPWWITQKLSDAYHAGEHFVPMFTYERSVTYPHGHRNPVFAVRGIRPLPRLLDPQGIGRAGGPLGRTVSNDDTQMLYRYLHAFDGVCASHTSATNMGTDWRDNDPVVEPIVEIYQGCRQSYEYEGAPRGGSEGNSRGGWRPAGFVDLALERGYRLGFQSSSDHTSTHISYCVVLAEGRDRQSILDALRRRHCYGATDNIIVDVRCRQHVMGDEFTTDAAPQLAVHIEGTGDLARVVIVRDGEVVEEYEPDAGRTLDVTWTDPQPEAGTHYYYVRVEQADGELAWASPMWVDYRAN